MEIARSPMPTLAPVDAERSRRDRDPYHDRSASLVSSTHSSSSGPNHTTHQPHGYLSQGPLSLTHLANAASKEFGTPPDSRRASGEEKDLVANQSTRQSLPSISEALGIDNSNASYQPVSSQAPQAAAPFAARAVSPNPPMRTYAAEPPQPHGEGYTPKYSAPQPQRMTPSSYASSESERAALSGLRPALHLHTPQGTPYTQTTNSNHQYPLSNPSPAHDRPPQAPAPTTAPATFPYGYAPYPPRYAQTSSAATTGATSAYHTPAAGRAAWETDANSSPRYAGVEKTYGESVKRHLDLYDLESALNDIASASNFLGDFSRRYGDLLHQSPQSGLNLTALPSIVEIEDMIAKSRTQTEALIKISETVLARQAAHDEHKAGLRQQKGYGDFDDSSINDQDDAKGPDAKKRRGRAAPPGRCHSCNRAETPEWRRGPDGARTLCNACGLHYAKLTRKANNAGKSGSVSSSNIRPKESLP